MNDGYCFMPITTSVPAAANAIHRFADEFISHGAGAGVILDAVAADPDCALAHAYAAALYLTQLTREGHAKAAPHIAAAEQAAGGCTPREIATIAAMAAWAGGDERAAVSLLRAVVESAPHDLVAAKLCQILELGIGDIVGMLRTSAMAAAGAERSGFALGLHAFALEQAGHPAVALRFAQRALECHPETDPWAQHAVAHALIAIGQPLEARAFLYGVSQSWERCSSFMQTHNWWHLALLELDLDNPDGALALFDAQVWGVRKGHTQDQINAISLLARLNMAGVETRERWEDIASYVAPRAADQISDFLDLHYLMALTQAGRDDAASDLIARLQAHPVAGALAAGIAAHARGDHCAAVTAMAAVRRNFDQIGGSNVQRSLFDAIFNDSMMRLQESLDGQRVAA
jgi:hypothetical protein